MVVNRQLRSRGGLHGLRSLLRYQPRSWEGQDRRSLRRVQQRRLLRQLLEADPEALNWLITPERGQRFWRALRWGGPALLLGWWLAR
ncbi:hypothetical protein [Synechococcus sp. MIT S9507]|uniref:hypothetical protein n=1 Tax=Synechococcus sp. MIT S9507 TaxID=3082544 RepID=UPI0023B3F903|nr:MAG: Uncharacterised protein [Cyanobium sp. ARS6]